MNPHPLVQFLQKPASEFTKEDILRYIEENQIEMVNFRYVAGDGRLKTLNFVVNDLDYVKTILSCGERVDGSSLFKNLDAGASDLYVIPRYRTAYLNPFAEIPTLDLLCSYYDKDGNPFESDPAYVMRRAGEVMKEKTGYEFWCMGELEYYVVGEEDTLFQADDQRGYHESSPFTKFEDFRKEAMLAMASCGCRIKYGHSEVGNFSQDGKNYEQNEVEFLPCPLEDAADQLIIAKWILRTMAYQHGLLVTFSPKITVGKAGSGMHIHTAIMKDGKNQMLDAGHKLSDVAKTAIAGYLDLAASLTAFGNTNPMSYFRLVPHQEAPTNICWGDRNRSALVRVPLGWETTKNMAVDANPKEAKLGGRSLRGGPSWFRNEGRFAVRCRQLCGCEHLQRREQGKGKKIPPAACLLRGFGRLPAGSACRLRRIRRVQQEPDRRLNQFAQGLQGQGAS